MVSCLLKHLTRKIKINVIQGFDVSNIIIKNEKRNSTLLTTLTSTFFILDNDVRYIETSNNFTFNFSSQTIKLGYLIENLFNGSSTWFEVIGYHVVTCPRQQK